MKQLIKTSLEPYEADVTQCTGSLPENTYVKAKRITLDKIDSVVEVYRMLVEKRRSVNEYYGIHILFSIVILSFGVTTGVYVLWYQCRKYTTMLNKCFVITRVSLRLVHVTLVALIGESDDQEVKKIIKADYPIQIN